MCGEEGFEGGGEGGGVVEPGEVAGAFEDGELCVGDGVAGFGGHLGVEWVLAALHDECGDVERGEAGSEVEGGHRCLEKVGGECVASFGRHGEGEFGGGGAVVEVGGEEDADLGGHFCVG